MKTFGRTIKAVAALDTSEIAPANLPALSPKASYNSSTGTATVVLPANAIWGRTRFGGPRLGTAQCADQRRELALK